MGRGQGALGACGERGVFCLETEAHAPAFQGRNGNGAMENPGQAGSLGAHAETNRPRVPQAGVGENLSAGQEAMLRGAVAAADLASLAAIPAEELSERAEEERKASSTPRHMHCSLSWEKLWAP